MTYVNAENRAHFTDFLTVYWEPDSGQERQQVVARQAERALAAVSSRLRKRSLLLLQHEHAFLDRAFRDQPVHQNWPFLSDAVGAVGGLVFHRGVPPGVE